MGNWNINIQGVGCHHNAKAAIDADLALKEFVAKLKSQGHSIEKATFTYGGREDFTHIGKDGKLERGMGGDQ